MGRTERRKAVVAHHVLGADGREGLGLTELIDDLKLADDALVGFMGGDNFKGEVTDLLIPLALAIKSFGNVLTPLNPDVGLEIALGLYFSDNLLGLRIQVVIEALSIQRPAAHTIQVNSGLSHGQCAIDVDLTLDAPRIRKRPDGGRKTVLRHHLCHYKGIVLGIETVHNVGFKIGEGWIVLDLIVEYDADSLDGMVVKEFNQFRIVFP